MLQKPVFKQNVRVQKYYFKLGGGGIELTSRPIRAAKPTATPAAGTMAPIHAFFILAISSGVGVITMYALFPSPKTLLLQ